MKKSIQEKGKCWVIDEKKFEMAEKKIGKEFSGMVNAFIQFTNRKMNCFAHRFSNRNQYNYQAGLNKTVHLNGLLWQMMFLGLLSRFHTVESIFVNID